MTFAEHSFESPQGSLRYLFSQPGDGHIGQNRLWPLIFFLHGSGERGRNLNRIRYYGIPKAVAEMEDFPFITVSPQCPPSSNWARLGAVLFSLLDDVRARYPVDANRVYLTGLSMGGYGTWFLALEQPERFAALAPVCPPFPNLPRLPQKLAALKDKPVWVFHGAQDDVVPLLQSERMVQAIRSLGGKVRFTVYPDAAHDSWTPTYSNPELYAWFLKHSLAKKAE